ncbi:siderophore-interacting protein [Streptomyces sp. NPDC092307]|uniref:siderophore-interacting protein n=1 Tax=Streptomyces sp. NPDC092307 TaxID=3366013 RepID=UPI00380F57B4
MPSPPPRSASPPLAPVRSARVAQVRQLTPRRRRVVLRTDTPEDVRTGPYADTDAYVRLLLAPESVTYPEPFDLDHVKATMPGESWPRMRSYTIRHKNPRTDEITLDFALHDRGGPATGWVRRVRPGDTVFYLQPRGTYRPGAGAAHHLLVGDDTSLSAVAAAAEHLPQGVGATVLLEVDSAHEEQLIDAPERADIIWLHRGAHRAGTLLTDAVRHLHLPTAGLHAFVHGEAHAVREIRGHLLHDRGVPRDRISASGYWRHTPHP